MATKTILLRPSYTIMSDLYTSETELNDGDWIRIPSTTLKEKTHLLINEVTPDDDSTYVGYRIGYSAYIPIAFDFSAIKNYESISAIRIIRRLYVESSNMNPLIKYIDYSSGKPIITDIDVDVLLSATNTWESITKNLNITNVKKYLNSVETALGKRELHLALGCGGNTKSSGQVSRTTQMYLEVDYEAEEGTPLYLKQNGTWETLNGTIYQKTNGSWVEADDSVFSNNDRYILRKM